MKTQVEIVSSINVVSFEYKINELLKDGWELRGQMIVNLAPYNGVGMAEQFYSQMMIKYPELPEVSSKKFPYNLISSPDRPQATQIFDSQIN